MTINPTTYIYYKQNPKIKFKIWNGTQLCLWTLSTVQMIVSSDAVCRKVHLYFQKNKRSYIESTFIISYKYFSAGYASWGLSLSSV